MKRSDYKSLLGLKIKQIRKSRNKTQEEFCSDIGLEIPSLSNIENGKVYPSIQTIINILEAYKSEPNDFFNFINWNLSCRDETIYNIQEYLKPLSDDLKMHILEIVKKLKN